MVSQRFDKAQAQIRIYLEDSSAPRSEHADFAMMWLLTMKSEPDEILLLSCFARYISCELKTLPIDDLGAFNSKLKSDLENGSNLASSIIFNSGYSKAECDRLKNLINLSATNVAEEDVQLLRDADTISTFNCDIDEWAESMSKSEIQNTVAFYLELASNRAKTYIYRDALPADLAFGVARKEVQKYCAESFDLWLYACSEYKTKFSGLKFYDTNYTEEENSFVCYTISRRLESCYILQKSISHLLDLDPVVYSQLSIPVVARPVLEVSGEIFWLLNQHLTIDENNKRSAVFESCEELLMRSWLIEAIALERHLCIEPENKFKNKYFNQIKDWMNERNCEFVRDKRFNHIVAIKRKKKCLHVGSITSKVTALCDYLYVDDDPVGKPSKIYSFFSYAAHNPQELHFLLSEGVINDAGDYVLRMKDYGDSLSWALNQLYMLLTLTLETSMFYDNWDLVSLSQLQIKVGQAAQHVNLVVDRLASQKS